MFLVGFERIKLVVAKIFELEREGRRGLDIENMVEASS